MHRFDGSLRDLAPRPRAQSTSQSIARARFPGISERDLSIAKDREQRYVKTDNGLVDLDRYYYGPEASENEVVGRAGAGLAAGGMTEDDDVRSMAGPRGGYQSRYGKGVNPRTFLRTDGD